MQRLRGMRPLLSQLPKLTAPRDRQKTPEYLCVTFSLPHNEPQHTWSGLFSKLCKSKCNKRKSNMIRSGLLNCWTWDCEFTALCYPADLSHNYFLVSIMYLQFSCCCDTCENFVKSFLHINTMTVFIRLIGVPFRRCINKCFDYMNVFLPRSI